MSNLLAELDNRFPCTHTIIVHPLPLLMQHDNASVPHMVFMRFLPSDYSGLLVLLILNRTTGCFNFTVFCKSSNRKGVDLLYFCGRTAGCIYQ